MTGVPVRATEEPRRRLHPLSPLLRSARLLALAIAAISIQGYAQLGLARWLGVVVVVLVGVIALSVVSWWFTGYQVVGRELRIHEGLLWRRTRAIPLERLQAVDVVRPALARLAGLAEVSLQVIGASKAEAPLAFLTVDEAAALRNRLLRLAAGTPEVVERPGEAPRAAGLAARPLHAVVNRDVLVSNLRTPQVWVVPFGLVFVGYQFTQDRPGWTFIGVASVLTATIGVLRHPVRRVLQDWNFRVAIGADGLLLRGGLLETRSQTIPPRRVQAIGVTWPLLWRPKGWLRCRIDVAGYGSEEGQAAERVSRLLPVGDIETARRLVREVLPGVDIGALPLVPPPARARWLAPLRQPVLGAGLTDQVFATTDGLLTRNLVVVPYARIQSVRVTQGPWQRRLRLATVHVDTAGTLGSVAPHRDLAVAWSLAAELAARAHAARAAT